MKHISAHLGTSSGDFLVKFSSRVVDRWILRSTSTEEPLGLLFCWLTKALDDGNKNSSSKTYV